MNSAPHPFIRRLYTTDTCETCGMHKTAGSHTPTPDATALRAAVDRILDMHRKDVYGECSYCVSGWGEGVLYPCETTTIVLNALGEHPVTE